ncbi:hybrid sensor histidine kinase/response regulator, partial [Salinivirga cyanobacteriivorans]
MSAKVLVVDDNPSNIQLIANMLDGQGFTIEVATSGKDALELLEEYRFDLILLDIMMPELNGYDTCRKIHALPLSRNIPVIFLTAKADDESITKGFEAGGVDYITKPFNSDELIARVKTHVQLKQTQEDLEARVKERTEQLSKANAELKKANFELQKLDDAKNEFINIISHEIRTPLNGIMGPLQLMNLDLGKDKMPLRMKLLNDSVNRLEQFAYRMILISELRTGRYHFRNEGFLLRDIVKEVTVNSADEINQKKLIIEKDFESSMDLHTDRNLFLMMLENVLTNSIRLSREAGKIKIVCSKSGEYFSIAIEDEAGGFSDKARQTLMKPFAPGTPFVNNNMGIGLYLTNLIVKELNGTLSIKNTEHGAIVSIA